MSKDGDMRELTDPDNFHFKGTHLQDPVWPHKVDREAVLRLCEHFNEEIVRHLSNNAHRRMTDTPLPTFKDPATWVGALVSVFNGHIEDIKLHTSIDRENRVDGSPKTGGFEHLVEVLKRLWDAFKAHVESTPH